MTLHEIRLNTRVEALSEQLLAACYQCGSCSAGCPFATEMDMLPHEIIRHASLGRATAVENQAIWLCSACGLCTERCPRSIDVARILEALRAIWLRQHDTDRTPGQQTAEAADDLPPIALIGHFRKNMG
jgi:heterodisulfide reductase subunit C